jgi:hypothetical protein
MSRLAQFCPALLLSLCTASVGAVPTQPVLTITAGAVTNHFTAAELLWRADLAALQIPPNVDYKVSLTPSSSAVARSTCSLCTRRVRPA